MEIASIRHKGLRRFAESGDASKLQEPQRLGRMLAFIVAAPDLEALATPPNFGFHALTGDRKGEFSMVVTRNWRLVFRLNVAGEIADLNLEDYH